MNDAAPLGALAPEMLVGQVIIEVAASWHEVNGERSAEPVHVWLVLERLGPAMFATSGGGLTLRRAPIHDGYDMGTAHGSVVVERPGGTMLDQCVGRQIASVARLQLDPPGMDVGWVLTMRSPDGASSSSRPGAAGNGGSPGMPPPTAPDEWNVAIADIADDFLIAPWPLDPTTPGRARLTSIPNA